MNTAYHSVEQAGIYVLFYVSMIDMKYGFETRMQRKIKENKGKREEESEVIL